MVTHVDEIETPPSLDDSPEVFEERAAGVWSQLARAVPQMNQQATEIEAVGQAAVAAGQVAEAGSDAAMGYRNEANAAKAAAQAHATSASQSSEAAGVARAGAEAAAESAGDAAQRAEAAAEAAEGVATNAVLQTSATGAAQLPQGNDEQRPAVGSIPAGSLLVRGSTQDEADYKPEFWDRAAAAWRVFASRTWVGQQITAAIDALQITIAGWLGFAIIYPNGGTQVSPANVSANMSYSTPSPFPGYHVMCEAQVLYGGVWSAAGWFTNNTAAVGVVAHQKGNDIITIVGLSGTIPRATVGGNAFGNSGSDVTTPVPCRVLCRRVKGAF